VKSEYAIQIILKQNYNYAVTPNNFLIVKFQTLRSIEIYLLQFIFWKLSMTQLEEILLSSGSKRMVTQALFYISDDESRVKELLNLLDAKTDKLAMRAAWVTSWLYEQYPLIEKHGDFLFQTFISTPHSSIRRSMGRVFAFSSLLVVTENVLSKLIDTSYTFLMDRKQPIVVRVYCIQILEKVAKLNNELNEELRHTLLLLANDEQSAAILSKISHQL